jgi:hypothetical protein
MPFISVVSYSRGAVAHYGPFEDRRSAENHIGHETDVATNYTRTIAELVPPNPEPAPAPESTGVDDLHRFPEDPNFGDYNIPPGGNHP